MTALPEAPAPDDLSLSIDLTLDAPRTAVWRCWTEGDLMRQWFAPKPWTTRHAEIEPRAGGRFRSVMCGPAGEEHDSEGVVLEAVPSRRLVWTSAFAPGWRPRADFQFVAEIALDDAPGGARYRATARHWSAETRDSHAAMGFEGGWTACARQLEALARTLPATPETPAPEPAAAPLRTCLIFDADGEAAVRWWISLLPDSRIERIVRPDPAGSPLVVEFTLRGAPFMVLNAPIGAAHSPAASISVLTADQAETDRLWAALTEGGAGGRCGWATDRFGVSWEIVPEALPRLLGSSDPAAAARVQAAMMGMGRIDIAALEAAHAGA